MISLYPPLPLLLSFDRHAHPLTFSSRHAHPNAHQHHSISTRSHDGWCDLSVPSYTGYFDTSYSKQLFLYFFESRAQPDIDPVIMWIKWRPRREF